MATPSPLRRPAMASNTGNTGKTSGWNAIAAPNSQPAPGKAAIQGEYQSVGGQGYGYSIFGVAPEHRDVPEEYRLDDAEHDPMVSRDVKAVGEARRRRIAPRMKRPRQSG